MPYGGRYVKSIPNHNMGKFQQLPDEMSLDPLTGRVYICHLEGRKAKRDFTPNHEYLTTNLHLAFSWSMHVD
jgi:hypothetical protein